jgi:hypothetical protein
MKVGALIGDGHTVVRPANLRGYPINALWLKDGLFIAAASEAHKDLLRARIVAVGKAPVDEAARRVMAVAASDNASGARYASAYWLTIAEAIAGVGLVDDMEKAAFTVVDAQGKERTVELAPAAGPVKRVFGFEKSDGDLPIHRRLSRSRYGVELLKDAKVLYCWYDTCSDGKDKPVAAWCGEVLARIDEDKPERIVLDVRRNGGGNSALLNPLFAGFRKRPDAVAPGKLFVLIDRQTFSSAILNAVDMRQSFKAVLVGLPTGGSLNGYGEVRTFKLPHCGWDVQYSTKYFKRGADGADTLAPDVEVDWTAAEYFSGADPALEAAIKFR